MADSTQLELQSSSDCTFVWDPQTRLYFHASSGFYHDPDAGWYYSSRDGLYYTFENGNYVLLDKEGTMADESVLNEPYTTASYNGPEYCSSSQGNDVDAQNSAVDVADKSATAGLVEDIGTQVSEHPPPPSEWLEDTLIDLYLSGYNVAVNSAADANTSLETDDSEKLKLPSDGNDEMYELEEGEWIPEENCLFGDSSGAVPYEGDTWDEENWRAQYGQVTRCEEEPMPEFPVVDLWDWNMVSRPKEDGKNQVARLIGRLVKPSAKVHPSVPSGGGLYKTAPICEVHLDLVRVRTGQVYKLRTPSPRYLASLSTYDSSDPTKDWGFPDLLVNKKASLQFKSRQKHKTEAIGEKGVKDLSILSDQPSTSLKGSHVYRDRAAERRNLHGGFGLGPGQKNTATEHDSDPTCIEDAKAEALNKSFGAGSYARRILEGMGWKEGEALGSSTKGLTEPLQPIGNIGSAGLGWPQTRHRCVPYRYRKIEEANSIEEAIEVLVISAQNGKGLLFPKGGWEKDESMEEAAIRETLEEAGVLGRIECKLGKWSYKSKRQSIFHEGHMFPLLVKQELDRWPEKNIRKREWVTVSKAREECPHSWMKEALEELVLRHTQLHQLASSNNGVGSLTL